MNPFYYFIYTRYVYKSCVFYQFGLTFLGHSYLYGSYNCIQLFVCTHMSFSTTWGWYHQPYTKFNGQWRSLPLSLGSNQISAPMNGVFQGRQLKSCRYPWVNTSYLRRTSPKSLVTDNTCSCNPWLPILHTTSKSLVTYGANPATPQLHMAHLL